MATKYPDQTAPQACLVLLPRSRFREAECAVGLGNIFTYVEGQGIFMYHDPTFAAVPEPSTCALASGGLLGLTALRRRMVI